jgi:hypothetical protein
MTKPQYSVKTENITAESGAAFLLEQLKKNYPLSIVHEVLIQNVCEAIEENTRRNEEINESINNDNL